MASILISGVSPRIIKCNLPCSSPCRPPLNPVLLDLPLRPFKQSHPHICKNFRSLSKFPTIACHSSSPTSSSSTENNNIIGDNVSKQQILEADAPWIYKCLPEQLKPYARLGRFHIKAIWLGWFDFPILWSIPLAADPGHLPDLKLLVLFLCVHNISKIYVNTINDLVDRDFDKQVERSKHRPFASGDLTPFQGLCFLGFQLVLFLGAGILLKLDKLSWTLWTIALLFFFIYPFMKRITYWPQAFLGLAMGWETLLGWQAVKGSLDLAILSPLFASTVFWVLLADTIYAHQDKKDDLKVGVKSTALLFGDSTKMWLTGFSIASIGCLALCGFNANIGWPYYAFLAAASGQLAWQIGTVDLSSPADCNSNVYRQLAASSAVYKGS
ncbi:hypothetical protein L6164_026340 [Bauhinia variegata]|uniref:Uncharacterized protein n=1 Tax=Bauhinia variegata TaxID=167791 RepID=A0ACB9LRE5_BAUVA|nr:hypothetical protein L6164_026340 [Bauhinia variegata]